MKSQPRKALHRKGDRNPFCPHYADCLDEAVERTWSFWDCSECPYKSTRDPGFDLTNRSSDVVPYYDLSPDIHSEG